MASDERVEEIRECAEGYDSSFGIECRCPSYLCRCDIEKVAEAASQRRELLAAYDRVKAERDAAIKRAEEAEGRLSSMELAYPCRWCGVRHLGGPENCKEKVERR